VLVTLALTATFANADENRNLEWHLADLRIGQAHEITTGDGVKVAVIDSGVDASHPDLVGNVLPGIVTFTGPGRAGDAWTDSNGHGTGMAGNIAAHGHGMNEGALGIAPAAKILPIADAVDAGRTNDVAMVASINYAVDQHAQVICLAQGGGGATAALVTAVRAAEAANIVIVAAVGNRSQGSLAVDAPANIPGVVAAASVDRGGNHFADSVTGPAVVLSAPGVDILHPSPGGGYAKGTGTSDATSIIAGAVALVRSKFPTLSATEVIHRLTATATDKGPPGRDDQYGYGVINIVAALTADVPPLSATGSQAPSVADQSATGSPSVAAPPASGHSATLITVVVIAVLLLLLIIGWRLARRRTR
jgi:type VII secretion-associated serine protease mycosin